MNPSPKHGGPDANTLAFPCFVQNNLESKLSRERWDLFPGGGGIQNRGPQIWSTIQCTVI